MTQEHEETRSIVDAWKRMKDKIKDIRIPRIQDADISDEELKLVLPFVRKRIKWAEEHPEETDPYEALGNDYQDNYLRLQELADTRGVVIDDLPSE